MNQKLNPQWASDIIEFKTRKKAIQEMQKNKKLKKFVLNTIEMLFYISKNLNTNKFVLELLNSYWRKRRVQFLNQWDKKIENSIYCECFGVMNNVYKNISIKHGSNHKMNIYDVLK